MKLLLTSAGISNGSIHNALVQLLGKPINECSALFIPMAIYPFPGGAYMAWRAISGTAKSPLAELGWKNNGRLELTALPGIDKSVWIPTVEGAYNGAVKTLIVGLRLGINKRFHPFFLLPRGRNRTGRRFS